MAEKVIILVFTVFFLALANGNIDIKSGKKDKLYMDESGINQETEGRASKRNPALIISLAQLSLGYLQSILDIIGNIERKIAIGIGNDTPYEWEAVGVYYYSGTSDEILPLNVNTGEAAVYPARKTNGPTATGAVGVLCYYIPDRSKSVCVMFSVPFDYNLYSNWWDVQVLSGRVKPDKALYKKMYNDDPYIGDNQYHSKSLDFGFKLKSGVMTNSGTAKLMLTIGVQSK